MKIATLPKSGTYFFLNIVNYLRNDRGLTIELDHVVMPNRPDFIDNITPTIITSRDPRGYFYSLLNWYNRKSDDLMSGMMSSDIAYRYFDPNKVSKWATMTDEERLVALVDDTSDSLMIIKSRDSYNAILRAQSKPNCYITTFERFAPAKDPSKFNADVMHEYIRMFEHIGIELDEGYIRTMIGACWGHSITYTSNGVAAWSKHVPKSVQSRIVHRYSDVYAALGYPTG